MAIASSRMNDALQLWDLSDRRMIREIDLGGSQHRSIEISPDGSLVAIGFGISLEKMTRIPTGFPGATDETQTIVEIRKFDSGEVLHEFRERISDMSHGNTVYLAFTPDGERVIFSDSTTVRIWEIESGRLQLRFSVGKGFDRPFDLSPDGRLLATLGPTATGARAVAEIGRIEDRSNSITLWDLESGEPVRRIATDEAAGEEIRLLPNNRGALTLTEMRDVVRLYDLQTGEIAREYRIEPDRGFSDITVAPDGRSFAVAVSDGTVLTYPIPEIP
jgi:WD40 repeat protein